MTESNVSPLRIGVIGVAANWRSRFRAALCAERERYQVRWIYDETYQRAAIEAKTLGAPPVDGLTEAMSDPELDAVLLLEDQWFRSWPVELACRLKKQVFCVPYLAVDPENWESILGTVANMPEGSVYFHRPARRSLLTRRLDKLLAARLGKVRLVFWQSAMEDYSLGDAIDWCLHYFTGLPATAHKVRVGGAESPTLETVFLHFGDGRAVQISVLEGQVRIAPTIQVIAEHGTARLRLPNQLSWSMQGSAFRERLRRETTPERQALREFYAMIRSGAAIPLNLDDERRICAAMQMMQDEQRTMSEKKRNEETV